MVRMAATFAITMGGHRWRTAQARPELSGLPYAPHGTPRAPRASERARRTPTAARRCTPEKGTDLMHPTGHGLHRVVGQELGARTNRTWGCSRASGGAAAVDRGRGGGQWPGASAPAPPAHRHRPWSPGEAGANRPPPRFSSVAHAVARAPCWSRQDVGQRRAGGFHRHRPSGSRELPISEPGGGDRRMLLPIPLFRVDES
jgi:hypothetical protein